MVLNFLHLFVYYIQTLDLELSRIESVFAGIHHAGNWDVSEMVLRCALNPIWDGSGIVLRCTLNPKLHLYVDPSSTKEIELFIIVIKSESNSHCQDDI